MAEKLDWKCGYSKEELQAHVGPFKRAQKNTVLGAFAGTTLRDIAPALLEGRLLEINDGKNSAGAIWYILRSSSRRTDFTGRQVSLPKGSVIVSDFAADTKILGKRLIQKLITLTELAPIYFDIFPEDHTALELVTGINANRILCRVTAEGEIKSLHTHAPEHVYGPAEEAFLVTLASSFFSVSEVQEVTRELTRYVANDLSKWEQHYSPYNMRHSWTAFALCGYDARDPNFIAKPAEMSKAWVKENPEALHWTCGPTQARTKFPRTSALINAKLQKLLGKVPVYERVRFMRLEKGKGELSRHADSTDKNAGIAPGRITRLHIPIITNAKVQFSAWSSLGVRKDMKFKEGDLFYLDQRKPHAAINKGDADRIHLVVDCVSFPALNQLVGRLYGKTKTSR